MSAIDTVQKLMTALEESQLQEVNHLLDENFLFSGWTPKPLDKRNFIVVMNNLKVGLPDLRFNLHNLHEHDNRVVGAIQVTGQQTDSFILPPLSLPPIPQLGKSVSLPEEGITYEVTDNKIASIHVQQTGEGGIAGLMHQLGFDAPIVQ